MSLKDEACTAVESMAPRNKVENMDTCSIGKTNTVKRKKMMGIETPLLSYHISHIYMLKPITKASTTLGTAPQVSFGGIWRLA